MEICVKMKKKLQLLQILLQLVKFCQLHCEQSSDSFHCIHPLFLQSSNTSRVEFWSKNDVRLAVNSGEKNFVRGKAPASSIVECGELLRFLAVKNFFHRIHRISYKKETFLHGFEPLTSCLAITSASTAPSVKNDNDISCELKISVEISAVNIRKICNFSAEIFLPHSAGSGEKISFTAYVVKEIFHRLNFFFTAFIALNANLTLLLKFNANRTSFSNF